MAALLGSLALIGAVVALTTVMLGPDGPASGQNVLAGQVLDAQSSVCAESDLPAHDGQQFGRRCVDTVSGEVAAEDKNPSLLITSAPEQVAAGQPFEIQVSTRNLVRERFLAAADGGFLVESALLNGEGLAPGHVHIGCRTLKDSRGLPQPQIEPVFFTVNDDGGGGATPDVFTVGIPGLPAGIMQCTAWAGDNSHRVPMMQRADQTPAFDSVRIVVT